MFSDFNFRVFSSTLEYWTMRNFHHNYTVIDYKVVMVYLFLRFIHTCPLKLSYCSVL